MDLKAITLEDAEFLYELLKQIYDKETFYLTLEEMNINPLKYEPVSYILWEIRDYFEEFKKLWKENKEFRFNIRSSIAIWSFNIAVWSFLIADIVSEIQK